MIDLLVPLHDASTWFMTGVIWVIQFVHYPLFAAVGAETFVRYQLAHVRRITPVVLPPMVVEAVTSVWLAWNAPGGTEGIVRYVGLALVAMIWLSTFLVQVPLHARLEAGFDESAHRRLVATNRLRTAAWTARAVLTLLV